MNIAIILYNDKFSEKFFKIPHQFESLDIFKNFQEIKDLMANYSLEFHYKIFYFIWEKSNIEAEKFSDLIINMDKLNEKSYQKDIIETFNKKLNIDIDFDDFSMKNHQNYSISIHILEEIEQEIKTIL